VPHTLVCDKQLIIKDTRTLKCAAPDSINFLKENWYDTPIIQNGDFINNLFSSAISSAEYCNLADVLWHA